MLIDAVKFDTFYGGDASWGPSREVAATWDNLVVATNYIGPRGSAVAPSTTAGLASPPNAAGWHNRDVTVNLSAAAGAGGVGVKEIVYSASGAQSVAGTTVPGAAASLAITAEGETAITYFARANDGATEAAKTVVVKLDKTPPAIAIATPAGGGYTLGQAVAAAYTCADGGSGVADCAGPDPSGGALDTATVGTKVFTVAATDRAGNAATQSVTYTVGYSSRAAYDQTKEHKSGSTVPIKLQLRDAAGKNVSSAGIAVQAVGVASLPTGAPGPLENAGNANPDNSFRYDPGLEGGGYIFNLKTKGLAPGAYELRFKAGADPTIHAVRFQVR